MNVLQVQTALKSAGFNPGALDGLWGRNTMAAVKAFQASKHLIADGIVGPQTSAALFGSDPALHDTALDVPPWFAIAKHKMGLNEIRNNTELRKFLGSDGAALGDPAKLPWCGDFVETCIALALPSEPMISNPYFALNWLKFGKSLASNAFYLGAVAVFERTGGGHVAFVAGHDAEFVHTLGGNQSNSVSISRILKSRLRGLRWPSTYLAPSGSPLPMTTINATITTNEA